MGVIKLFQDDVAKILAEENFAVETKMAELLDVNTDASFEENFNMMIGLLPPDVLRKNTPNTIYDAVFNFLNDEELHYSVNYNLVQSPLRRLFDSDVKLAVSLQEWKVRKKKKIVQKLKLELCRKESPGLYKKYTSTASRLRSTRDMIDRLFGNKAASLYTKRYGSGLPSATKGVVVRSIETKKREAESNVLDISRSPRAVR